MNDRAPGTRSSLARAVAVALAVGAGLGCGGSGAHAPGHDGGAAGASAGGGAGGVSGAAGGAGAGAAGAADGGGGSGGAAPSVAIGPAPTWRLTNTEYTNTVRDLLGPTASFKTALEPEEVVAGYRVGGAAYEPAALDYHAAAVELAAQAVTHVADFVPCAPATAGEAACAAKFVDAFVPRAFRRPLAADRRASLLALHAQVSAQLGFETGVQAVIERVLQSPYFLYHLELEEQAHGAGSVMVEGYSMASRLSYLLWASMPDDALLAKAAAGQLSTRAAVRTEAARMLESPRARDGLRSFYEQWMRLPDALPLKSGRYAGLFSQSVAAAVRASFDAQMDDALWRPQGSVSALVTSRTVFVNAAIASLFGAGDISGDALQPATLTSNERAGILGHPAIMSMLATETTTRPIHRGEFVLDQVLCQPVLQPPPNEPPFAPVVSLQTVRQQLEGFTASATCRNCHASLDSLGFLFEGFDAIGKRRVLDDLGNPIDTAVTLTGTGDPRLDLPTADLADFGDRLGANDGLVTACLASQLYRFTVKRDLAPADDAVLADLAATFAASGESINSLLLSLTQTDAFLFRNNQP